MVLDLESGWALVPGTAQHKETAKMKVKCVLRFWYGGKLVDKDQVVEVDESLGREVIASGKAVKVEEAAPAAPAPKDAAQK